MLLLMLLPLLPTVVGKIRDVRIRQGGLHLPPLDPALLRSFLTPEEISAFARETALARRDRIPDLVRNGLPQFGVGPLDPFSIGDLPVNFTMDVIELEGDITHALVRGLSGLQLLDLHLYLPGLTIEADLHVPLLEMTGDYMLDGSFSGLFPLTGAGPLSLRLKDVDIKLIVQLRLYYDRFHITRIDFTLGIGNTTVNLEGFLKDSGFGDVAQQFLDSMSGDFLRNFIKMFRQEQLPSLVMRGNKFLRDYQWRHLLPDAVALYLGFDESSGGYYHDHIPTITNNYLVDRILGQIAHYLRSQRIGLPSQDIVARKKVLWWNVRNGIRLDHGRLFGLENMRRVSDALISRHKEYFTFTLDIKAFHLKAAYKSQLVILNKPTQFVTWAYISHVKLRIQLQLDAEYMDLYLTGLDVIHIGDINIELAGLGPVELLAQPVIEYKINLEASKRMLAKMVARDARDAIAKMIANIDINAIIAETINGDVYARNPGIVFPDPPEPENGTDFSSLLDSVLGVDGDDDGEGLGSLLDLLLDDDEEEEGGDGAGAEESGGDDDEDPLAGVDPAILESFGLEAGGSDSDGVAEDSAAGGADSDDPLAGVDPDILAAFGLEPDAPSPAAETAEGRTKSTGAAGGAEDDEDPLAGIDPDILASFGLEPSAPNPTPGAAAPAAGGAEDDEDPLAGIDPDILASFGLEPSAPAPTPGAAAPAAAAEEEDALAGVDADILAAFGLEPSSGAVSAPPGGTTAASSGGGTAQLSNEDFLNQIGDSFAERSDTSAATSVTNQPFVVLGQRQDNISSAERRRRRMSRFRRRGV